MKYQHDKKQRDLSFVIGWAIITLLSIILAMWLFTKFVEWDLNRRPLSAATEPLNLSRTMIKPGVNYGEQHTNHARIQATPDNELVQGSIDE